jgi:hypothetical protein
MGAGESQQRGWRQARIVGPDREARPQAKELLDLVRRDALPSLRRRQRIRQLHMP